MKKFLKGILALSCAAVSVLGLSACGNVKGESTALGAPKATTALSYTERNTEKVKSISASAEKFAADFASLAYKNYEDSTNFAVAPVSVYMALSLAAQCSAGETQSQILSALGITYNNLTEGFSSYYRSVIAEYTERLDSNKKVQTGMIDLTNSVWLDSHTSAKQDCINTLADKFFCYSFEAPFADDNASANEAVRKFVKDKTRGLIDQNFGLSAETMFTLINTLYLKDFWDTEGKDLTFTDKGYDFKQADGSVKNTKLLRGYSNNGRVVESVSYSTFFSRTANGNKIDFILPKDGYSVEDIFTSENIEKVKNIDSYNAVDHDKKLRYHTSCLFPEFTAEYNKDITALLQGMGINALFDKEKCDFSAITDERAYCDGVVHATKLNIDRKGIEGAAVTIMPVPGDGMPDEYSDVYIDFVIDRAFGFIVSDRYGNTLFSGVVKQV